MIHYQQIEYAEANLSTKEAEARAHARIPFADAREGRAERAPATTTEGTEAAHCLTRTHVVCMLTTAHRLTRSADVERVSRRGRPVFGSLLTLRVLPNHLAVTRMTAVAGLKVSKRSVERNRVKRLLREAFRARLAHLTPGVDVVIHAKSSMVGKSYHEVYSDLDRALVRSRILQSTNGFPRKFV